LLYRISEGRLYICSDCVEAYNDDRAEPDKTLCVADEEETR